MEIAALVEKFGLAVGLLLYFVWRDYQTNKEHKADMRDIAIKSVQAIDKGTEAINDSTKAMEANNKIIDKNSNLFNTVKGVLLKDGGGQNGSSGN